MKIIEKLKTKVKPESKKSEQIGKGILPFEELKAYAEKYYMKVDSKNQIEIKDRKTRRVVTDKEVVLNAAMANLWLISATINLEVNVDNDIPGMSNSFGNGAEDFYYQIMYTAKDSWVENGKIDTLEIYDRFATDTYRRDVIIELFKTDFRANLFKTFIENRIDSKVKAIAGIQPLKNRAYIETLNEISEIDYETYRGY